MEKKEIALLKHDLPEYSEKRYKKKQKKTWTTRK